MRIEATMFLWNSNPNPDYVQIIGISSVNLCLLFCSRMAETVICLGWSWGKGCRLYIYKKPQNYPMSTDCTTVACLPTITGLEKCELYDITHSFWAFVLYAAWTKRVLHKGTEQECTVKLFFGLWLVEGNQHWYKLQRFHRSHGICNTLKVTRLRLVIPLVYHIHSSFHWVYRSLVNPIMLLMGLICEYSVILRV